MGAFQLYLDGVDFSDYIQQETDITETLRKVYGPGQQTAVDGTTVPDLIANKIDPAFRLMPMPRDKYVVLWEKMKQETIAVEYTSIEEPNSTLRSITALPSSLKVQYATLAGGERVYDGTLVSFQEQ